MKTIDIIVSPNGQSRVETKGFAGSACRAASQFVEQALGRRIEERMTAEYHTEHHTHVTIREEP